MKTLHLIGGGLAGLALGISLRQRGVPVQLYEAQAYPRHRLCGEFLHGQGEALLTQLGLGSAELPASAPLHEQVLWADSKGSIAEHPLPHPVRGLSRFFLDQALAKKFQDLGGILHIERLQPPAPQQAPQQAEGWVLCTGRERQLQSPWFGIKQQFAKLPLKAGLEMHLGKHGYLGLTQVEDGWVNACGIFRRTQTTQNKVPATKRLHTTLQEGGLNELAERIQAASARPQSLCAVAALKLGRQHPNSKRPADAPAPMPQPLRLGDQRLCTSPLSGNGQSMALEAGVLAAPVVEQWASGQLSWAETQRHVEAKLHQAQSKRLPLALALHRAVLSPPTRKLIATLARQNLLPFTKLAKLISQ